MNEAELYKEYATWLENGLKVKALFEAAELQLPQTLIKFLNPPSSL